MSGLPPDEARRLLGRLVHDVGKHVARAARNLPERDVPPALVEMLAKDLYALRGGARASAVFAGLAGPLLLLETSDRLREVAALLAEADRIEGALRAGEPAAVARGAAIALAVERSLRDLLAGR